MSFFVCFFGNDMENTEKSKLNSEKIWKLWKKSKLNSEKIGNIWKKDKLSVRISRSWRGVLDTT